MQRNCLNLSHGRLTSVCSFPGYPENPRPYDFRDLKRFVRLREEASGFRICGLVSWLQGLGFWGVRVDVVNRIRTWGLAVAG